MEEKSLYIVMDARGFYKDLVFASRIVDPETQEDTLVPENYTLSDGDALLLRTDACPQPTTFVKPRWNVNVWEEGASPEELDAWQAEHPAAAPSLPPLTETQLALAELAELEAQHDLENKLALAELAETMGGV